PTRDHLPPLLAHDVFVADAGHARAQPIDAGHQAAIGALAVDARAEVGPAAAAAIADARGGSVVGGQDRQTLAVGLGPAQPAQDHARADVLPVLRVDRVDAHEAPPFARRAEPDAADGDAIDDVVHAAPAIAIDLGLQLFGDDGGEEGQG